MMTRNTAETEIKDGARALDFDLKGDEHRGIHNRFMNGFLCVPPATLHDAINMARELIEQGVQAKALRIAPAKGRGYVGNLPWCNRCKAHHQPGPCPPRCGKCHKLGHQEGECQTRIPVARDNSLQQCYDCFGVGIMGTTGVIARS
ncbi:hypothetical protein Tco_0327519 [Tanacetum coccineum]